MQQTRTQQLTASDLRQWALAARHPQIGAARIEDGGEVLRRCANRDHTVILGLEMIRLLRLNKA